MNVLNSKTQERMKKESKSPCPMIIIWNLLLVRTHPAKVIFICRSHVNNLKLHGVILTDQWGLVLKITTQYDRTKYRFQIIFIRRGPCTGDLLSPFILSCNTILQKGLILLDNNGVSCHRTHPQVIMYRVMSGQKSPLHCDYTKRLPYHCMLTLNLSLPIS